MSLNVAEGDGVDASSEITVNGGTVNIVSGGGYENGEVKYDWGLGMMQEMSDDSTSTKGLKADKGISINAGEISISSTDDAVHSNGNIVISGGKMVIYAGDDAIHADESLTIAGGTVDIRASHEGLESANIDISGGDASIYATDNFFHLRPGHGRLRRRTAGRHGSGPHDEIRKEK